MITGAGFSAPAKLPIQDKILDEMIAVPTSDFMNADPIRESIKFLTAYINIAIYLLKVYGNVNTQKLEEKYDILRHNYWADNRVASVLRYIRNKYGKEADIRNFNLEDVFTAFDKSISMRENTKDYSYIQMDILQHSLLRLFVYYFANRTNRHTYMCQDYENVILFLKRELGYISVITTNWDVLLEQYIDKAGIKFDYNFNSEYVINEISKEKNLKKKPGRAIKLLKIHGSINWFRCLRCGTLQICGANECGQYLFDDLKEERCYKCGQNANKIIFCGYSLPVADFEFRYLLKQNIKPTAKIDVVLYHNDDPSKFYDKSSVRDLLPEKRFKDLFSGNECNFYYEGFGEYFKNVISKT